jgi:hypothetical protein
MRIFPKFFYAPQGFKKKYNMPCHAMHPMQDLFLESFSQVL